ncbi:MAG: DMT family transporter, partial [Acidilobus sp.]
MGKALAAAIGERPTIAPLIGGLMVVLGVAMISRGQGGGRAPQGVLPALGLQPAWASGWVMIRPADVGGLNPVASAFLRASTAGLVLSGVAYA